MATQTFVFVVSESLECGPPDKDGECPNHHLQLEHKDTKDFQGNSLNNAQSPLFKGVHPGSKVTITVEDPTEASVKETNDHIANRQTRQMRQVKMPAAKPAPKR